MSGAPVFSFAGLPTLLLPLVGTLMIFGFATVFSGTVSCGLLVFSIAWLHPGSTGLFGLAGGLSLVLMLVGPGAYSLDARFFGLRRIEIVRRPPKPKS